MTYEMNIMMTCIGENPIHTKYFKKNETLLRFVKERHCQ